MYKEYIDPSFTWKNFNSEEQRKILACDRSNNLLDTTLLKTFAPEVRHIKDAVRELLQKYKKYDKSQSNDKITQDIIKYKSDFNDLASTVLFVTGGAGFIGSNFINKF